jgi:hypothetical protein
MTVSLIDSLMLGASRSLVRPVMVIVRAVSRRSAPLTPDGARDLS